jgi:hypothetical protein
MSNMSVYIAGDWHHPPRALADRFEANGWTIVDKWWDDRENHHGNVLTQREAVQLCTLFVLDMRSPRFGKTNNPFAGSHFGMGMASAFGKAIRVLLPEGEKPYTSQVNAYCTSNEDALFPNEGKAAVQQTSAGGAAISATVM